MRKRTFHSLKEAEKLGPYAEMPMMPDDKQIQVYISRNDRPQPFYLICAKDSMVAFLTGGGEVEFKQSTVERLPGTPGSFFYVPAGVPHRILPSTVTVTMRYKHRPASLEGVAWYCGDCGAEVHRDVFDPATSVEQAKYQEIALRFAGDEALRKCPKCGSIHPSPDIADFKWDALAKKVVEDREEA